MVEESRELIAERLSARPTEVVFTGGGTESDNLAVKGLFWARSAADPRRRRVLVSAVEHHAVLDSAAWLAERHGAEAVLLPVDGVARLDLAALAAELAAHGDEIALVSVMWANNEVGTVQPVAEVVALAHRYGIPVHADAVQAVGQLPVGFTASGLDAMTVSAHKLGGPLGVGALLLRRDLGMTPVLHGGGQERGVRSGTLPAALIRSFAVAVDAAVIGRPAHAARVGALRDALLAGVLALVPDAVVRGPQVPDAPSCVVRRCLTRRCPTPQPASRGTSRSPSPAVTPTPSCTCWTARACSAQPGPPAMPVSPRRRTCCSRWA